jgi:hypothetical protein
MASELKDRLTDLAEHTGSATPPPDLWTRGVRRRRLARATTAAMVAVVVLLLGAGGLAWNAERRVEPVGPPDSLNIVQLPDRFYWQPSPWLPPFAEPPGPLVLVFTAVRNTFTGQENGVVGVTGSSGTYGFLDLPRGAVADQTSGMALSPDGRHLAFWMEGQPSGSANTTMQSGHTITGVGMYDTVTGRSRASAIPTEHGLMPTALIWSDDSTLFLSYAQILNGDRRDGSAAAHYAGAEIWGARSATPTVPPPSALLPAVSNYDTRATAGRLLVSRSPRKWAVLDPSHAGTPHRFTVTAASDVLTLSPDLTEVAGVAGHNGDTGPLTVGTLPPGQDRAAHLHVVRGAGRDWYRPLAWVDAGHVAALRRVVVHDPVNGDHVSGEIDLVDVESGSSTKLVSEFGAGGSNEADSWLATDYLGARVVPAIPPPSPRSPRVLAVQAGLVVAATLGLAVVLWRRRARRP